MKRNKWINYNFSSGSIAGDDYLQFQKDCLNDLKKMATKAGLKIHKFNKGHYYFSAVLTDGEKFIYISHPDVRGFGEMKDEILVRTMAHAEDWTGGRNNWVKWSDVGEFSSKLISK